MKNQAHHFFHTAGAVTAVSPTAANIDAALTTTNTTFASSFWKTGDTIVLRGIVILARPGATDSLTIKDSAGTAVLPSFAIPTSPAGTDFLAASFGDGISLPITGGGGTAGTGGYTITTTAAGSIYLFLFDLFRI